MRSWFTILCFSHYAAVSFLTGWFRNICLGWTQIKLLGKKTNNKQKNTKPHWPERDLCVGLKVLIRWNLITLRLRHKSIRLCYSRIFGGVKWQRPQTELLVSPLQALHNLGKVALTSQLLWLQKERGGTFLPGSAHSQICSWFPLWLRCWKSKWEKKMFWARQTGKKVGDRGCQPSPPPGPHLQFPLSLLLTLRSIQK